MSQTQASPLQQLILTKKSELAEFVREPMAKIAAQCSKIWPEGSELDSILGKHIKDIPYCKLLYAWNRENRIVSSMILLDGADDSWRDRDIGQRPYLVENLPFKGIMLSSVYASEYDGKRSITALQAVNRNDELLGFIAADFGLRYLLGIGTQGIKQKYPSQWQQYRGDPAVRGTLFMQQRATSRFDLQFDKVVDNIRMLYCEYGVFHAKIHFSSGRCAFWFYDDPYDYRILSVDDLLNPDLLLAYAEQSYPADAKIEPDEIGKILEEFKGLRFADETVYLRSSSINIINSVIGLTFSCDGSHYMAAQEFLDKNLSFWLGNNT